MVVKSFILSMAATSSLIINFFSNLGVLSSLFQAASLFFATILIPLAIAIFKESDFKELDENLILDYVLKVKLTIFSLLYLLFIPILWEISLFWIINLITFVLYAAFIFLIIFYPLRRSYLWLKKNRYSMRFQYLEKNNSRESIRKSWNSVWGSSKKQYEVEFLEIFEKKIDRFIKNNNPEICGILLRDFLNYIFNRSFQGLISILPKTLEWRFEILNKTYNKKEDNFLWDSGVFPPLIVIREIIREIIKRGLKSDNKWWVEKMFQKLKEYIDKHKGEKINDGFYLEFFFKDIDDLLFEKMAQSSLNYEICSRYFPSEWKITKGRLKSGDKIPTIIFKNFIEWIKQRIIDNRDMNFDNVLDYDLRCFFPNVSSTYWAKILLFVFSSWTENSDYKNKVDYIIKNRKINFGLGESPGPAMTFSLNKMSKEEAMKKAEKEWEGIMRNKMKDTFELVNFLSEHERNFYFFKKNLEEYITALRNLEGKLKPGSNEEYRRQSYLEVFSGFSNFLKTYK